MALGYVNDGTKIPDLVAPAGGVKHGRPVIHGEMLVIALTDAAAGETYTGHRRGIWKLPKETGAGTGATAGDRLFWDPTAEEVHDTDATGRLALGFCAKDSSDSDTLVNVLLTPDLGDVVTP